MPRSIIAACLLLITPAALNADTFVREYTYDAGETESKVQARRQALRQVQLLLLEELGVLVQSQFKDAVRETADGVDELTERHIEAATSGITKSRILNEKWTGDSYYIKAEIDIDPTDLTKRLETMSQGGVTEAPSALRILLHPFIDPESGQPTGYELQQRLENKLSELPGLALVPLDLYTRVYQTLPAGTPDRHLSLGVLCGARYGIRVEASHKDTSWTLRIRIDDTLRRQTIRDSVFEATSPGELCNSIAQTIGACVGLAIPADASVSTPQDEAEDAFFAGNFRLAYDRFRVLARAHPESYGLLRWMKRSADKGDLVPSFLVDAKQFVTERPDLGSTHNALGNAYFLMAKHAHGDEAALQFLRSGDNHYSRAMSLDPKARSPRHNHAVILCALGEYESSIRQLESLVNEIHAAPEQEQYQVWLSLANAYQRLARENGSAATQELARRACARAISIQPTDKAFALLHRLTPELTGATAATPAPRVDLEFAETLGMPPAAAQSFAFNTTTQAIIDALDDGDFSRARAMADALSARFPGSRPSIELSRLLTDIHSIQDKETGLNP